MSRRRLTIGLPLLGKELVEIANRPSTYVLRVLYTLTLFGFVLYYYWHHTYGRSGLPYEILGTGRELFGQVVQVQLVGIYILAPLLTASCITSEKERDTLQLLFLTRLGPWTILFEKLLGRLVPMAAYLLLTMPVFAVAYSLGGVETAQIENAAVAMVAAMLHAGTVALFCSTWCRTTPSAFLMTYVVLLLAYLLPVVFLRIAISNPALTAIAQEIGRRAGAMVTLPNGGRYSLLTPQDLLTLHIPLTLLDNARTNGIGLPGANETWRIWAQIFPLSVFCVVFLLLARRCLIRRANVSARNYLLVIFRAIDTRLQRWNERYTRGIVLVNDHGALPEGEPIFRRETRKRSLGTFRYLVRILLVLELPAFLLGMIIATGGAHTVRIAPLSSMIGFFWIVAILGTAVRAATLFASERSQSTLDVLLTTPMRAEEMLREKVRALRRFGLVLATPLFTCYAIHTITIGAVLTPVEWLSYFVGAVSTMAIYLPLVCWTGVLVGLRSSSQARALFSVLAVLVLVGYVAPAGLLLLIDTAATGLPSATASHTALITRLILPASYPLYLETEPRWLLPTAGSSTASLFILGLVNGAFYGALLWLIRRRSLQTSARLLGRPESEQPFPYDGRRPTRAELYRTIPSDPAFGPT